MTNIKTVWIIDDDESVRWVLERALKGAELEVACFSSGEHVMERLTHRQPDAIISDIRMPGIDGLELLKQVHAKYPSLPVIIMTAHADLDNAVAAFQDGAFDYLPKPFDIDDAVHMALRAIEAESEAASSSTTPSKSLYPEIIGEAPAMQEVFRAIGRLAPSKVTVLINGESGTGKELVARALHKHSCRKDGPFVAINVAAIPNELVESELFGHEKGAFTGAVNTRTGRFEQAESGTLFLDEIGDMPLECQTRLLRVLSNGEFYRVGGHDAIQTHVRIIAATHQNLWNRVQEGKFREDLFHRINVIRIQLPSLRERPEDVPRLAQQFLQEAASQLNIKAKQLRPEVETFLTTLPWPGNVRELENLCHWLTVMVTSTEVQMRDLPDEIQSKGRDPQQMSGEWETKLADWAKQYLLKMAGEDPSLLDEVMPKIERILIHAALKHTQGKRQEAAELLGWGRNTLTRKIQQLKL